MNYECELKTGNLARHKINKTKYSSLINWSVIDCRGESWSLHIAMITNDLLPIYTSFPSQTSNIQVGLHYKCCRYVLLYSHKDTSLTRLSLGEVYNIFTITIFNSSALHCSVINEVLFNVQISNMYQNSYPTTFTFHSHYFLSWTSHS